MIGEVLFTSSVPVAERIKRLLAEASGSIDCALYRLGNATLAQGLRDAAQRGVPVRVILDRGKVGEGLSRPGWLEESSVACRLSAGRSGLKSKMHHKFAVFDRKVAVTGSYNWSDESEQDNYENLVILREPALVEAYVREFEELWKQASEADMHS
jgi:mitochondrial cardiolipin hydrolase